jgi:hypothetical protein
MILSMNYFDYKKNMSQEPSSLSFELCHIHFIHCIIIPVQSQCMILLKKDDPYTVQLYWSTRYQEQMATIKKCIWQIRRIRKA